MKELSLKELQEIQLDLLDHVAAFCKEKDIEYFLCGGALLGAVREGKLIPWDDDIDLYMPRRDYERFVDEYEDSEKYRIMSPKHDDTYYYPFVKVSLNGTVFHENAEKKGMKPLDCLSVGLDIFPVDFYPDDDREGRKMELKQRALQALCYKDFRFKDPKSISMPVRAGLNVYRAVKGLNGKTVADYIDAMGDLWSGQPRSKRIIDTWTYWKFTSSAIFPTGTITLEGKEYPAPNDTNTFLTECYGPDYMVPKVEQPDGHGKAYRVED